MFDVFYCVILNSIIYRFVNGDQLNLVTNDHQLPWAKSFDSCDDPTYWYQLFNNCQPESCNASFVTDKIIQKKPQTMYGSQQYWIYGYVRRSPVIVNIGCYSLNASVKSEFNRGIFISKHNSAFECSMACPDNSVEYIFLRGRECLCIPRRFDNRSSLQILLREQENTGTCNQSCPGNNGDLCGSPSVVDGKLLYSVFQVLQRSISNSTVGSTCSELTFDANTQQRFGFTACNSNRRYICERYNKSEKSYKDNCINETTSWYAAQQNCQEMGLQFRAYTGSGFTSSDCKQRDQVFWIGNHVAERIVWANDSLPKGALCMKLVIKKSGSSFETENCDIRLTSLCYTQQQTSSGENDEAYITSVSTQSEGSTGRTTIRSLVSAEYDSDEVNKRDFIPIVAGSVGGFVAIVIVVIIVCVIQRRKKSNNKHLNTAGGEGGPETYSEPIKNTVQEESRKLVVENTIPEENTKLVNVTEEGIYNHLGETENMFEMKPQDSSIYDVTGDDEYHVFTGNGKQSIKDDDDLYDHGAASDVYNTLNDTVTPNRPESDTYNVINAK